MKEERVSLKMKIDRAMEDMGPFTPVTEAASSLTMTCLDEIMANMDGTIKGEDPECLHDMRVASRRLRAALRVFCQYYPKRSAEAEERARFVTSLLGQVRDLDVRIIHLDNIKPLLGPNGRRTADLLIFNTHMQWDHARERMIEGLSLLKGEGWYGWMKDTLSSPVSPNGREWAPSIHSLSVISENRTTVIARSHLSRVEMAIAAQHALRIAVKRYRYSLELLSFCLKKKKVGKYIGMCKTIQDDLGLMHDYDVLTEHISVSRTSSLPKAIKKGLNELALTIAYLRYHQYELFIEHLDPFLEMDPEHLRK